MIDSYVNDGLRERTRGNNNGGLAIEPVSIVEGSVVELEYSRQHCLCVDLVNMQRLLCHKLAGCCIR